MANLKTTGKKSKAQSMGMHTEVLTGRTQQKFFNPDEAENFYYFGTHDVDFNKQGKQKKQEQLLFFIQMTTFLMKQHIIMT